MQTAEQSTLNKHSHFHLAVFLTLCDKALSFLGVTSWMNVRWYVYINVWNRHLIPIQITTIQITTIPTPIPITTIPTPIPTPPKWTTNDSDSDSDSGIGVGIVVWFRLRSRNRPRSGASYRWTLIYCIMFCISCDTSLCVEKLNVLNADSSILAARCPLRMTLCTQQPTGPRNQFFAPLVTSLWMFPNTVKPLIVNTPD